MEKLGKGMIHIPGRMEWEVIRFYRVVRKAHNLILLNCFFMEFPIYYFWFAVDHG